MSRSKEESEDETIPADPTGIDFPLSHAISGTPLDKPSARFIKRTFDIVLSLTLMALSPLVYIPVALAIKWSSPGPVLFRQKRSGKDGKVFYCYKFRTMRLNDESDTRQARHNDPRITPVGRFLRLSSIDELPQVLNVLRGEMSFVGPRPHMLLHTQHYSALIPDYMQRLAVKPGITGWAQANRLRGTTEHISLMEKRVRYDLWYIRNWSPWLDLRIMLLTLRNILPTDEDISHC